jgi:hypothetical protein
MHIREEILIGLEFFGESSIEKSKNMLYEKFLIDFYNDNWIKENFIFDNLSGMDIFEEIHKMTTGILVNYQIPLKECIWSDISNVTARNICTALNQYVFENIKFNLCMLTERSKFNGKMVILSEALSKYSNIDIVLKNKKDEIGDFLESSFSHQKNNVLRTYKNNLKKIPKELMEFFEESGVIPKGNKTKGNKFMMYELCSDVFMHILYNWNLCMYNTSNYENLIKFTEIFIKNDIGITELILLEKMCRCFFRINSYNIINIDFSNFEMTYKKEIYNEINELVPLLPNTINSYYITNSVINYLREIDIGSNESYVREFKRILNNLVRSLTEYYIPLYNSVFANLMSYHCKANKISIQEFLHMNCKPQDVKKEYDKDYIKQNEHFKKIHNSYERFIECNEINNLILKEIPNIKMDSNQLIDIFKIEIFKNKENIELKNVGMYHSLLRDLLLKGILFNNKKL